MKPILKFIADDSGVSIVEYALLLGLIMFAVVGTITAFGTNITSAVSKASAKLVT